jgi:hypothetical protein
MISTSWVAKYRLTRLHKNYRTAAIKITPFTMTKPCVFILFCSAALFSPTAGAFTAIAVATSSDGGGEQCGYQSFNPTAPGKHGLFLSRDLSRSEIEQGALKRCRHSGGIHPRIVLSTAKYGNFAIAVGVRIGTGQVVGWSGPLPSPEAAADEAIAKCKERGGTNPHIQAQWHDYYHSFEKRVYDLYRRDPFLISA